MGGNLIMEWIDVKNQEPKRVYEDDVYTTCICGKLNEWVVLDAVYVHETKTYYHNQDTTFNNPLDATHFIYPINPPTNLK